MELESRIQGILSIPPDRATADQRREIFGVWEALRAGVIRTAEKMPDGAWKVQPLIKEAILWAFKAGVLVQYPDDDSRQGFTYTDKDTLPYRIPKPGDALRVVPGGTSIRDGSYIAPGVIIMPPSYINIGVYIDEGTLIDSHVLVGSCAQIGKRVHLSAGVQVGGVLEPVNALPVIIEDDVLIGGNCGIYEGTVIHSGAVIGTGVILTGSTPIFDLVNEVVYRKTDEHPLEVPPRAVVVQGSRPSRGLFAESHNIHIYAPIIVKYRDEKTDAATALEEALRG